MPINMSNTVVDPFNTQPTGGVKLYRPASGGYYDYDHGGKWVAGEQPEPVDIPQINIQPSNPKTIKTLINMGGTANPRDVRQVWINDGETYLYPEDTNRPADKLEFSDGISTHLWRVMDSDNRPWHNYCKAIVERIRNVSK